MAPKRRQEDFNARSEGNSSEPKRQELLSMRNVVQEVMRLGAVERFMEPGLEQLIRRVVKEEIKLAQETSLTSFKGNSRNEIHPSESKIFQLCFLDKLSLPVLTGIRIQGEKGTSIRVALVDGLTKKIVNSGPEASAKVEIVVIEGDFDDGEGHYWTIEEFNQKIVRERKGKKCFLIGDAFLNMKGGLGTVGDISVTHNLIWMKNGEFRLGARVVDDFSGTRVREAISEPFILKDRRSSYNERSCDRLFDQWQREKIFEPDW